MTQTITLSNGQLMPIFGLGTWDSKPNEVTNAVKFAVKEAGYRHIDCAFAYFNEDEVGTALKELFDEGIVKREDIFITTKIWNTYHSRAKVVECLKLSLQKSGLNYVDLCLIHWPLGFQEGGEAFPKDANGDVIFSDVDYLETWQGMEDCYEAGLTKSIGVSNFNSEQIARIIEHCKVKPVMNQVECHVYLNQEKLKEFCFKHGVSMTAYSPLGSPNRFFATEDEPKLLEDPKVLEIAKKYNKTAAQVLIRFNIDRGIVCIPKSVTNHRIAENAKIFDFSLTKDDIQELLDVKTTYRYVNPEWMKKHKYFAFNSEF